MKYIECHGTPREMGHQYGEQARAEILRTLEGNAYRGFAATIAEHRQRVDTIAANLRRRLPDVAAELAGIAEGCGASFEQIVLLNHVDTLGDDWVQECTPVGLVLADHSVMIAKNNDGAHDETEQYPFVIRKTQPATGFPMLQVTYAGWLSGLDAMNGAGLANTHASVGSVFDKSAPSIDIRLAAYQLMRTCAQAGTFCERLRHMALTGKGFNIIVGDREGQALIVEAAVPLLAVRVPDAAFFYTTNHFVSDALKDADCRTAEGKRVSQYRRGYLDWLRDTDPPADLAGIRRLLSSHEPWAPCRHGGPHVSETGWSQICRPAEGRMLVSSGPPCECEYQEFGV